MQNKDNDEHRSSVRAVERVMDILDVFSPEHQELTLADLCLLVDLPKTTIYRLLATMEYHNWVIQDPETGKYRLGYELVRLGSVAQSGNTYQKAAKEMMNRVAKETGQTCNLYIRDGFERLCIAQVMGTEYVRRYSYLGARHPLYCGAGKLLLAYADEDFQRKYFQNAKLEKYTENTIVDENTLRGQLLSIVKNGFSVTKGERDEMTAMVSVPLFDYTERVIASVTISGPIYQFNDENIAGYIEILKAAAEEISAKLGYKKCRQSAADK